MTKNIFSDYSTLKEKYSFSSTELKCAEQDLKILIKNVATEDKPSGNAPFGKAVRSSLDYMLGLAKSIGLKVDDVDGYAGSGELNIGADKTVGILTHLDVVPIGAGWTKEQGQTADGRIYGRGAIDNLGPTIACFYALKRIVAKKPKLNKNIRLIWGCNEESGNQCMEYYLTHRKMPDIGFSPDADFPIITCEKTILHLIAKIPCDEIFLKGVSAVQGGQRANIVPEFCSLRLSEGSALEFTGKAAHAMRPEKGDNAVWKAFKFLANQETLKDSETVKMIYNSFCFANAADILGIALVDPASGDQTINLGKVELDKNTLNVTLDLRCPVNADIGQIKAKILARLPKGTSLSTQYHAPYLFADSQGFLAKTLKNVFTGVTGLESYDIISGGGTYARKMPSGIAFGPMLPEYNNRIHDKDEFIDLWHLNMLIDIYEQAMESLAE